MRAVIITTSLYVAETEEGEYKMRGREGWREGDIGS